MNLLQAIPETGEEMKVYNWWWETQGRNDLAFNAANMVQIFELNSFKP